MGSEVVSAQFSGTIEIESSSSCFPDSHLCLMEPRTVLKCGLDCAALYAKTNVCDQSDLFPHIRVSPSRIGLT